MKEFCSGVNECDRRNVSGGIGGCGVKEYSCRVDRFVLLGHRSSAA